ncbi:hypothetical protein FE810_16855 [Thalassotalea litorea]|uniref:DUF4149 domain-containing protein n=1 Tax=Thalassotalea litorea TaxID=2020715 RepID=A0A5R9IHP6_9GAMM|nr:hypothetical protein [Thalassotalea litorea]TLU59472.1 hypothetical protein FE810_16855 [Thalassotalea litorea]
MSFIITLFATCSLVIGIIGLLKPVVLTNAIEKHYRRPGVHYISIMLRVIIGLGLVVMADDTRAPIVIELMAWLIIGSAIFDAIKGRQNHINMFEWLLKYQHLIFRVIAGTIVALAGFLLVVIY